MDIRRIRQSEFPVAFDLLVSNGWQHRIGSLGEFAKLMEASQIADIAIIDGHVVGFVRGITDGLSNGYLSMVVVASGHRGKGIGRKLVEHAMGTNSEITWVLRAGREGATGFFAKLGFEVSSIAMERLRA